MIATPSPVAHLGCPSCSAVGLFCKRLLTKSGQPGSNRCLQVGSLGHYHYTMPALTKERMTGFEPVVSTVARSRTTSCATPAFKEEGVGFEPTGPCDGSIAFPRRPFQPLTHPSVRPSGSGRIRTCGALSGPPAFEAGALNQAQPRFLLRQSPLPCPNACIGLDGGTSSLCEGLCTT